MPEWKTILKRGALLILLAALPVSAHLLMRRHYARQREQARASGRRDMNAYFAERHQAKVNRESLLVGRRFPQLPLQPASALPEATKAGHPLVIVLIASIGQFKSLEEWARLADSARGFELLVITEDAPARLQAAVSRIGSPHLHGATVPHDYLATQLDLGAYRVVCSLDARGIIRYRHSVRYRYLEQADLQQVLASFGKKSS